MNVLERAGQDGQTYKWINKTGVALVQYQFVLHANPDNVTFPICGYVPDEDGIAAAADTEGNIRTVVGDVWQVDQIDASFVAGEKDDAVFMTPGAGNLHAVRIAGDFLVGKLYQDIGDGDDYVIVQFTPPLLSVA